MAIKLVTYDLSKPGQNYTEFHKVIKGYASWAKLSESSYAIDTLESPDTVYNKLSPHMDRNDQLYVIPLGSPWQGWGPKEVNNWLSQHLN